MSASHPLAWELMIDNCVLGIHTGLTMLRFWLEHKEPGPVHSLFEEAHLDLVLTL
ncbi:hypothetical protein NGUA08_03389 [Salmonella enterica]|nr:hypothetical protein NGUA08_03389 [Salmonella enterica]